MVKTRISRDSPGGQQSLISILKIIVASIVEEDFDSREQFRVLY
jgi:hypothetical protein